MPIASCDDVVVSIDDRDVIRLTCTEGSRKIVPGVRKLPGPTEVFTSEDAVIDRIQRTGGS